MQQSKRLRLVVDASVARASGASENLYSINCRKILDNICDICHSVIISGKIKEEWDNHRSPFSTWWLGKMIALEDKVVQWEELIDKLLRKKVESNVGNAINVVLKDIHLVEAAFYHDMVIISLDNRTRKHLCKVVKKIPDLKSIIWINPDRDNIDQVIEWLKNGNEELSNQWKIK